MLVSDSDISARSGRCGTCFASWLNRAEPGWTDALAALLSKRYVPAVGKRVGIVLCIASTNAASFPG